MFEYLHGFDPQLSISIDPSAIKRSGWSSRIPILSDHEREAAYARARMVLKAEMEALVVNHGWLLHISQGEFFESSDGLGSRILFWPCSLDQDWFHVSSPSSQPEPRGRTTDLRLPITFSSFLGDGYNLNRALSDFRPVVKRLSSDKIELSISEDPAPLANIFYILQIIAPGMLGITYTYEYTGSGELEWSRVLPQPSWIQEHRDMLVKILGNLRKYEIALNASKEPTTRCKSIMSRFMVKGMESYFNAVEFYASQEEGLEEVYPYCAVWTLIYGLNLTHLPGNSRYRRVSSFAGSSVSRFRVTGKQDISRQAQSRTQPY